MYTHIGNGTMIKNKDVIGVFDIKVLQVSRENKRMLLMLEKLENKGQEKTISHNPKHKKEKSKIEEREFQNKSVILMEREEEEAQYELTPIAVSTLRKRFVQDSYQTQF